MAHIDRSPGPKVRQHDTTCDCTQNRTGFPARPSYGLQPVEIHVLTSSWKEHRLLDSGDGLKLEEFAGVRVIRSEPKAWWHKSLPPREWAAAVATHEESGRDGRWRLSGAAPKEWEARFEKVRLHLRFMDNSKQIGVFPEQSPHWEWLSRSLPPVPGQRKVRGLHLGGKKTDLPALEACRLQGRLRRAAAGPGVAAGVVGGLDELSSQLCISIIGICSTTM